MPILVLLVVQLYCLSYVFLSYNIITREGTTGSTSFLPSFFPIMLFLEDGKCSKKFLKLKALRVDLVPEGSIHSTTRLERGTLSSTEVSIYSNTIHSL